MAILFPAKHKEPRELIQAVLALKTQIIRVGDEDIKLKTICHENGAGRFFDLLQRMAKTYESSQANQREVRRILGSMILLIVDTLNKEIMPTIESPAKEAFVFFTKTFLADDIHRKSLRELQDKDFHDIARMLQCLMSKLETKAFKSFMSSVEQTTLFNDIKFLKFNFGEISFFDPSAHQTTVVAPSPANEIHIPQRWNTTLFKDALLQKYAEAHADNAPQPSDTIQPSQPAVETVEQDKVLETVGESQVSANVQPSQSTNPGLLGGWVSYGLSFFSWGSAATTSAPAPQQPASQKP